MSSARATVALAAALGCAFQAGTACAPLFEPRIPAAPRQPTGGPGSSEYMHARVIHTRVRDGALGFHLFEPADPAPDTAPVIAFLHGYGAMHPFTYRAWINHLVRRGAIVVFPLYQSSLLTRSAAYTDSALTAIVRAYELLESDGNVRPHAEHFAVVGHSIGGVLAANVAAEARRAGLPSPKAVMLCNAGDVRSFWSARFGSLLDDADYGSIPADVLMLAVIGDRDFVVPDADPIFILRGASQVPVENKEILLLHSDSHGVPPLRATHAAAAAVVFERPRARFTRDSQRTSARRSPADALDFFGYWKWLDALTDAAFYGLHREHALGGTFEQTYMGTWSDGTPVRAAELLEP